jgi:hypothetical protein
MVGTQLPANHSFFPLHKKKPASAPLLHVVLPVLLLLPLPGLLLLPLKQPA